MYNCRVSFKLEDILAVKKLRGPQRAPQRESSELAAAASVAAAAAEIAATAAAAKDEDDDNDPPAAATTAKTISAKHNVLHSAAAHRLKFKFKIYYDLCFDMPCLRSFIHVGQGPRLSWEMD